MCAHRDCSSSSPATVEVILGSLDDPYYMELCRDHADYLVHTGQVDESDVYPLPVAR
jgi:hypothetical protein